MPNIIHDLLNFIIHELLANVEHFSVFSLMPWKCFNNSEKSLGILDNVKIIFSFKKKPISKCSVSE